MRLSSIENSCFYSASRPYYDLAMRALLLIAWLAGTADAQRMAHRDPERVRADLKSMMVRTYEMRNGKLVETGREQRTYDKAGQILAVEHRGAAKVIARLDYKWSNGRIAKHVYSEPKGRRETRLMTYKVDANGRLIEKTLRDPAASNGERYVTTVTWDSDGSRIERTARHYTNPYDSGSESYDKSGRLERDCTVGSCQMLEYDAHGQVDRIRDQMGEDHAYRDFTNTYDANGRLATQKTGVVETTFHYGANGEVTEETRSDGTKTVYQYVRR